MDEVLRSPYRLSLLAGVPALACAGGCTPIETEGEVTGANVTVDETVQYQSLVGFGAAVGWYQDMLVGHSKKAEIYDLVFEGMGLDMLRFRNRFQRSRATDANLAAEQEIVERAEESLGRRPAVLLTSWSPPAELKQSGEENCQGDPGCTLRRGDDGSFVYDEFADYWAESLGEYDAAGIRADYISIQNEPDFLPNGWEGCRFDPTEADGWPGYDQALVAVADRVASLEHPPRIVGPETLGIHWGKIQDYVAKIDRSLVFGLAHHLYESGAWVDPDSYASVMSSVGAMAHGLPIFQTEFSTDSVCSQDDEDCDDFVLGGFETAWLIQNSLVQEGTAAFLYWDLVWPHGGLVALEGLEEYAIRDQYYALRHFARFTDPGDVRVRVASDRFEVYGSAFVAPDGDRSTVILLNIGARTEDLVVDLGREGATRVFQTEFDPGETEAWVDRGELNSGGELALPPRSVTTIVVGG